MALMSSLQYALQTKGSSERKNVYGILAKKIDASSSGSLHLFEDSLIAFDSARIIKAYTMATARWEANNYPDALALMRWRSIPKPNLEMFPLLKEWFENKEEEFETWERENRNVYYATATPTMPNIDD